MTRDEKERLLNAFDLISGMASGKDVGRHSSHGSGLACLGCGQSNAVAHAPGCVVNRAIQQLVPLIPPYADREKWLAAS